MKIFVKYDNEMITEQETGARGENYLQFWHTLSTYQVVSGSKNPHRSGVKLIDCYPRELNYNALNLNFMVF